VLRQARRAIPAICECRSPDSVEGQRKNLECGILCFSLRPCSLHGLRPGVCHRVLVQGPRGVPVLQRQAHDADRRPARRSRHPAGARATVGDLRAEAGAGRFEKPAPDARAAPPEAHESLISRKTGAEVPLTRLSVGRLRALSQDRGPRSARAHRGGAQATGDPPMSCGSRSRQIRLKSARSLRSRGSRRPLAGPRDVDSACQKKMSAP
jgi:hypothetical protein